MKGCPCHFINEKGKGKNHIGYDSIMIPFLKVERKLHSLERKYKTRVKDMVGYTLKYCWKR